mmetsp:Transcript_11083/g.19763  ORF Transcript_11083/g.19763 Transcript_11083/m.19763 type:complete len:698 (+) Transcript_11083:70-2163(+)
MASQAMEAVVPSRLRLPEYRGRLCDVRDASTRDLEATMTPCRGSRSDRQGRAAGRCSFGGFAEDGTPIGMSDSCRNFAGVEEEETNGSHRSQIRVAVRVRPLPACEDGIIEVASSGAIAIRKDAATGGNEFLRSQQGRVEERTFDKVFGPASTQTEVFSWSCASLLSEAVDKGRSATVFVYGATGAGKTHTMFGGSEPDQHGIIFRAIPEVFKLVAEHQSAASDGAGRLEIKISFLEIYNEVVRDLLQEGGCGSQCRVLEDERRGMVKVTNLVEAVVHTPDEALRYLRAGMQARTTEATAANTQSSRAHAVFSLTIEQVKQQQGHGPFAGARCAEVRQLHSKISLIDLAGSERASFTQNTGNALKDGARINQSLLALANCIDALATQRRENMSAPTPRKKPPYRDSKLTLMLKGSLTGDGLVAMIANVQPGRSHFEDSNNTLEYAKRASTLRSAAARRTSKMPSQSPLLEECSRRTQEGPEFARDALETPGDVGNSSSSTLPHKTGSEPDAAKSRKAERLPRQPSSVADSALETVCPEECLSELSLGSGGESQEEADLAACQKPSDEQPMQLQASGLQMKISGAGASAAGSSASICPPSTSSSRTNSADILTTGALGEVTTCTSEEAGILQLALKLITKLQQEKVQLDSRLQSVMVERDMLLQDRMELEKENAKYRSADLRKDKEIASLLSHCQESL